MLFGQKAAAQGMQVTLNPTLHHGYHISCFGGGDGAIDLTVTGGTPPYTYMWSTGATTQDVSGLRAGYVSVRVRDAASGSRDADLTLTEPFALRADVEPFSYPSGFNISCYNCYNGSIQVTTLEGVAPYTYAWADGPTTEDRTQLDAGSYAVDITDVNGCAIREDKILLTQPERDDWSKSGNAGSDPNTQFLGTTDNKDLVLKANGTESLRLKSNGDIKLGGSLTNFGLLYRDQDGTLRAGGLPEYPPMPNSPCRQLSWFASNSPYWKVTGNTFAHLCPEERPLLGTLNAVPLSILTNNQVRVFITTDGKVGIGTEPEEGAIEQYRLFVEDGIVTRDVLAKLGEWPDYVFADDYRLMQLKELRSYLHLHRHLPGIPSAADVIQKGGVELGDTQKRLVKVVEEQALYILQLEERLERLEALMVAMGNQKP